MKVPAVFLDRDGTLIEDPGYLDDPAKVRLLPGVAMAVRRLRQAGYLLVVASNQSGVARGLFSQETLSAVHQRLEALLRAQGATLDGAYYCPYLDGPEAVVEGYRKKSDLRKPEPGLLRQAADELDIDLTRSWMIGDSPRDVEAGRRAGCRTILVDPDGKHGSDSEVTNGVTARDLAHAAELVERAKTPRPKGSNPTAPAKADDLHNPTDSRDGDAAAILAEIRDELGSSLARIQTQIDEGLRQKRQNDFSALGFFGALLQMLAIAAAVWGGAALLSDLFAAASARFMLACFLQLAAISALVIDRLP